MTIEIGRRQSLVGIGTVSLAALLSACSDDDAATPDTTTTSSSTTTTTPSAPSTTVVGGATITAAMFDDAASCALSPEQTEGPYYFDVDSIRTDIREGRDGAPLRLGIRVRDAGRCSPIADAVVDVWHCDAVGTYSGFEAASRGGPGGGGGGPTDDETFLRGAQVTNGEGIAELLTVYPGWYRGRTVHIHVKVHLDNATVLTSQLFFDDSVSDEVYAAEPYASHGERDQFNDTDGIFDERLVVTQSVQGDEHWALINLDVDTNGTARSVQP
ncbi:MAG TPA: intradiol ring-cleavage dioxygenase [Microthrixaceae bacterium]|nr:intradiol ring-cleavage dioxygenase [Microthrixaceae bacterium]